MLSGRGLCDELITRPEESYRLCCVVVCDLETSRMGAPYIYDISRVRVKSQRLPRLLRKFHAFCRTRKYIRMYAALRDFPLNAVHTLQSYFFEISFNTIPFKPASFMWSISMRLFPPKFCMHLYAARHVTYFSPVQVLGFINCMIFGEMHVSQSSSVCNFLKLKILYLRGAAGIKRYRFCPAAT